MKKKKALALVPAAPSRSPQTRPAPDLVSPTRVEETITAIEEALGGRQGLIEALSVGDSSPDVMAVLQYVGDPRFDRWTLAHICAECRISPGQLFEAFDRATILRAQVLAHAKVAEQTPAMVGEMMILTRRHEVPCTACNGTGTIYERPEKGEQTSYICTSCQGRGTFLAEGDLERQKIALGMMKLTTKDAGVTVPIQINNPAPASSSLVQLQQVVTDLLYGASRRPSVPPVVEPPPDAPD